MASEPSVETLEKGSIYFFYHPKIEEKHPESESDVQRLYFVMSPDQASVYRLALIGQKELPDPEKSGHRKYWGSITMVRENAEPIRDELGPMEYETKTRGKRHVEAARPAGEGVYRIVRHGDHTHLVYALELPQKPGDVQEEFNIEKEASYIVTVKNPDQSSPRGADISSDREAEYPQTLKDKFRGRRFSELDPPDFLDYEGAEFILIAASSDVKEDLGIQLHTENETATSADIFKDLHIDRSRHPTKPLFKGAWE